MNEKATKIARIINDLADMKRRDDEMRKNEETGFDDAIVEENTNKLKEIVKEIGWPTISLVGKESAKQAWDIVQHVTPNSDFHFHCLKLMKECPDGEVEKSWIAHFEDRIRTNNGKPQLYGTEFRQNADGHFEPFPIEDIEQLDARRQKMGMKSFDEFAKQLKEEERVVIVS